MVLVKFPPGKFPPGIFKPIFFLRSFFTFHLVHNGVEGGECTCTSSQDENFDMSRMIQYSYLIRNSNNQRKSTISRNQFPS